MHFLSNDWNELFLSTHDFNTPHVVADAHSMPSNGIFLTIQWEIGRACIREGSAHLAIRPAPMVGTRHGIRTGSTSGGIKTGNQGCT